MSGISSVGAVEYLSTRLQPVTALVRPDAVQMNTYRNPLEITSTDNVRHTLLLRDTVDELSESLAIVQITDDELRTVGDYLTKIQAKLTDLSTASATEAQNLKKEIKELEDAMSSYLGQKVLSRENPVLENFAKVSGQHQRRFFEVVGNQDYPEIQAEALAAIEVNLNYLIKEHHDPSQCPMCQSSRSLKKLEGTSTGTVPEVTENGKGVVTIDPVEALLIGSKWNVAEGENLTYSFYQDPSVEFAYEEAPSVVSTIGDIEERLDEAFTSWNSVAGLSLQKVEEVDGKVGAIRSAFTDSLNTEGAVAFSYQPGATAGHGDIFYNYEQFPSEDFTVGSFAYYTALHEIGHALGLSHTHQDAGGSYLGKELSEKEDTIRNSVMSYDIKDRNTVLVEKDGQLESKTIYASTPMRYDIQAMETLYGRSTTSNVGDTVYQWADRVQTLETIYDSDGIDTLDASNQTQEVHINLQPGSFQSIGIWSKEEQVQHYVDKGYGDKQTIELFIDVLNSGAKDARVLYTGEDNITIAYSSYIENAIGGQSDDVIIGNDLDNVLKGNAGNNILIGGRGYDIAVYDGKRADYRIEQNLDSSYSLTNLQTKEVDTLKEIEKVKFEDTIFRFASDEHAVINVDSVDRQLSKDTTINSYNQELKKLFGIQKISVDNKSSHTISAINVLGSDLTINISAVGGTSSIDDRVSANAIEVTSGDLELNLNASSNLVFSTLRASGVTISSDTSEILLHKQQVPPYRFISSEIAATNAVDINISGLGLGNPSFIPYISAKTVSIVNTKTSGDFNISAATISSGFQYQHSAQSSTFSIGPAYNLVGGRENYLRYYSDSKFEVFGDATFSFSELPPEYRYGDITNLFVGDNLTLTRQTTESNPVTGEISFVNLNVSGDTSFFFDQVAAQGQILDKAATKFDISDSSFGGDFSLVANNTDFTAHNTLQISASGKVSLTLNNSAFFQGAAHFNAQVDPAITIQGSTAEIILVGSTGNTGKYIQFSAIHTNQSLNVLGAAPVGHSGNFTYLMFGYISAGDSINIDTTNVGGLEYGVSTFVSSATASTFNVKQADGGFYAGGFDKAYNITEKVSVAGSATIDFSGTRNASINLMNMETQGDLTLNATSAKGTVWFGGPKGISGGAVITGQDFFFSSQGSDLDIGIHKPLSVSGSVSIAFHDSLIDLTATSIVSNGSFFLDAKDSQLNGSVSNLLMGQSGWTVSLPVNASNTSISFPNFQFSGGGVFNVGGGNNISVSAQSIQKGGIVSATFDLSNNPSTTLSYTTKDTRDLLVLEGFSANNSITFMGAGNHQKVSVNRSAAVSMLNAALNTDITTSDLLLPSSAGSYSGLYTYNGDSYFFGFSDGDSVFEKGEAILKFSSNASVNLNNINASGFDGNRSTIPEVVSSTPANNELNVNVNAKSMRIDFDQEIFRAGLGGEITLQAAGGNIVERFDLADVSSGKLSVSGTSVILIPENLDPDTIYLLNIPDNIFKNSGEELSAGTQIKFQTNIPSGAPGKIYKPIVFTNARLNLDAFPSLANFNIPQSILDNVLAVLEGRETDPHGLIGEDFNDPEALLNLINALQATIAEVDAQRAALGSVTGTLDERMQVVAASQSGDISTEAADSPIVAATLLELIKAQIQSLIDEQLTALSNISEPVALELLNND